MNIKFTIVLSFIITLNIQTMHPPMPFEFEQAEAKRVSPKTIKKMGKFLKYLGEAFLKSEDALTDETAAPADELPTNESPTEKTISLTPEEKSAKDELDKAKKYLSMKLEEKRASLTRLTSSSVQLFYNGKKISIDTIIMWARNNKPKETNELIKTLKSCYDRVEKAKLKYLSEISKKI